MNARTLCLAMLNSAPMSGYDIRKLVADGCVAHFAEASYGSIYPALDRMEGEGLVTAHEERQPGKPPRRVYSLTAAGQDAFLAALHEAPGEDVFRSPFLLLATWAPQVRPDHLARAVDDRLGWARGERDRLRTERARIAGSDPGSAAIRWTLDYGLAMFDASIAYLEGNRGALEQIAGTAATGDAATASARQAGA